MGIPSPFIIQAETMAYKALLLGLVLVAVTTLASARSIQPSPKPAIPSYRYQCPPPGYKLAVFFPHPRDCRRYYECVQGKPMERLCTYGTAFDRQLLNCNFLQSVQPQWPPAYCPSVPVQY